MTSSAKRDIFTELLIVRCLKGDNLEDFLNPNYDNTHDPFLLSDMNRAVQRLALARKNQEAITIHGDYDVDGITATALLIDALKSFGFSNVNYIRAVKI